MNQKGFSLIEVAVSIAIITIGLISIVALFSANIRSELKNEKRLIAVYLANESIEMVRQQRDNHWFNPALPAVSTGNKVVVPQAVGNPSQGWNIINDTGAGGTRKVFLNNNSYLNNVAGTDTGFERYLTITTGTAGCLGIGADCMEVISHVSFGGIQLVEVTAYFYDGWY